MINELVKKSVFVDEAKFSQDLEVYSNKLTAIQNIKKEIKKFIPNCKFNDEFFNNVLDNFYSSLLLKYKKQNTLNLRAEKLAELLEFDLSELKKNISDYENVKDTVSPSIDSYTLYAESDDELMRLDLCEKLINNISEIESKAGVKAYPFEVTRAFRNIVNFDVRKNKYLPNHRWIKDLRY